MRSPRAKVRALAERAGVRAGTSRARVVDSAAWAVGERFVTLAITWIVGIVVANHLGVSDFGRLMYAVSLVLLFGALAIGAQATIVVRDLVRESDRRDRILGTVFVVRLLAGLVCIGLLMGATFVLGDRAAADRFIIAVLAIGMLLASTEVVEFWFQSESRLRYVAWAGLGAMATGNSLRLVAVAAGGGVDTFAWLAAGEQVLRGALLLLVYRRTVGPVRLWRFEPRRARDYVTKSVPLMLSGAAETINLRIDQVMLGGIVGSAAVGTYAVAARLSEVWYVLPVAVMSAAYPVIVRAKEQGEAVYRRRLQQLYGAYAWGAVAIAVVMTFAAEPLIGLLYDKGFQGAADVLVIHVWSAPFLFMGVIFSRWLVVEGLLWTALVRNGLGAAMNVGLNVVLIPAHGPTGAAVATLVSYATATYGAAFVTRSTRPAAVDMTLGMLYPLRLAAEVATGRRGPTGRRAGAAERRGS